MNRRITAVLYAVATAAVVVGVDVAFFRNRFWERLAVNIGIVACGLTPVLLRTREPVPIRTSDSVPAASNNATAPFSRAVLVVHALAFFLIYFGVTHAVLRRRVPVWFVGQRVVASLIIVSAVALMVWAVRSFPSFRFRAKLDAGHQLTTSGPFRWVRHPIYGGLNLFALGTAVWVPTAVVWAGFVLMVVGSELRARAEEALLDDAFGSAYREYRARTRRFIPGIY
jgi:protein-S-isoprenylcysteine O-methyltransferase Ste14